jgi:hypothetical protein
MNTRQSGFRRSEFARLASFADDGLVLISGCEPATDATTLAGRCYSSVETLPKERVVKQDTSVLAKVCTV